MSDYGYNDHLQCTKESDEIERDVADVVEEHDDGSDFDIARGVRLKTWMK